MSQLPSGWAKTPIGELIQLNPKNTCDDNTEVGFVPMPLMGTTYLSKLAYERRPWREVKKGYTHFSDGDVLLGKITPCFENGKAGLASELPNALGAGSTEYFVCRPQPTLHPRYLLAYFKTRQFVSNGAVEMTGSVGHKRVPKDYVTETKIPLAPLLEQKRIADKLDSVLARVDACRDRLDRLPALLKRFRQSILAAATSGQLTGDWREEVSLTWNPLQTVIGKIGEVVTGSTPSKKIPDYFGGSVPFFKPSELDAGFRTIEAKEYLTDSGANQARLLPPRTVMVTCIGATIGKTGLSRCAGATNQQINSVICDESIAIPEWLYFWCESPTGQMAIIDNSSATTLPILNKSRFMALEIEIPPLPEQTEIVRRVDLLFAFADRLEARLASARQQVGQLTPALLAKAFRGELVAQDPADEPAAELLKRLAAQRAAAPKTKRGRAKG